LLQATLLSGIHDIEPVKPNRQSGLFSVCADIRSVGKRSCAMASLVHQNPSGLMKKHCSTPTTLVLAAALLVAVTGYAQPAAPQGVITAKEFLDIGGGTAITDLTGNAKFPNTPDLVAYPERFEWPTGTTAPGFVPAADVKNNYGVQIIGYLYPPTTGNYVFGLAADDGGQLFLSTDADPANKKLIAQETSWSAVRSFAATTASVQADKNSSTFAGTQWQGGLGAPIALTANTPYYIEALMKEGGGGDNLAVTWAMPGQAPATTITNGAPPIPGQYLATIDRTTLNSTYLSTFTGNLGGVFWDIIEPNNTVNQGTVQMTLDGNPITATSVVSGGINRLYHLLAAPLVAGTTHTATLAYTDSGGNEFDLSRSFTVAPYATVPASYALAAAASTPGVTANRIFQFPIGTPRFPTAAENSTSTAEAQLAGEMVDPNTGNPRPNAADDAGPITIGGAPEAGIYWTPYVNWEQAFGNINATGAQPDNFNSLEPPGATGDYGNYYPPGVSLTADPTNPADNFVIETIAYARLKQGLNTWGVNSDDGFKVTVAPGQPSSVGLVLGEFSGGRGASDTLFDFWVEADGDYPVRLLWWEGNGGANCEWFSVNLGTREKILIGDTQEFPTDAVPVFRTGQGRAHVRSIAPAPGYTGASREPVLRVELANGTTSYVAGSGKMFYNGTEVTPTVAGTVFTYAIPTRLGYDSQQNAQFVWQESTTPVTTWTNSWTFRTLPVTVDAMPDTSFWIEVEDWDHSGGQTEGQASSMPYAGGAYSNLVATLNVDYFDVQNIGDAGIDFLYRTDERPNHANLTVHTGTANLAQTRPNNYMSTVNYRLGWVGSFWGNYTRTIPAGAYRAYAALSHGDGAGIFMNARLDRVTAGVGTTSQTLANIGSFYGSGSTGWGTSVLVPLRSSASADAALGAFNHPGGPVTLRFTAINGDADWFVFVPATDIPPTMAAGLSSPSVSIGHIQFSDLTVPGDVVLAWTLTDQSTAVDTNSISLMFDGADVSSALTIEKAGAVTTVTYDPPGLLALGQSYAYDFAFNDSFTPPQQQQNSGTLLVNYIPETPEGAFLIEAEDFNTGGGDYLTDVDTMPYLGGAYTNLSAVEGIDYQRTGQVPDGDVYRIGETNNVPMGANQDANTYDVVRSVNAGGTWTVTANYSTGWSGVGNWMNYTRDIPANTYQVWAGMSSDRGGVTNGLVASLAQVTSSASASNQVTQALGTFQSAGTRDWGRTALVPMRNTSQEIAAVAFDGVTTLRVSMDYGDVDYLMLIPTGVLPPPGPEIDSITIEGANVVITWTGDATLQSTSALPGTGGATWGDVAGTSPVQVPISGEMQYFRLIDNTP
jgi:hypothetical protein